MSVHGIRAKGTLSGGVTSHVGLLKISTLHACLRPYLGLTEARPLGTKTIRRDRLTNMQIVPQIPERVMVGQRGFERAVEKGADAAFPEHAPGRL